MFPENQLSISVKLILRDNLKVLNFYLFAFLNSTFVVIANSVSVKEAILTCVRGSSQQYTHFIMAVMVCNVKCNCKIFSDEGHLTFAGNKQLV